MSKNRWQGGAPLTAQISTVTIGTYDATTTYSVSFGNYKISQIGTGGTNATTAAALVALLQASTIQPFAEITWTVNSAVITGTAKTAGYNFVVTTSVATGTGTISNATTTANSGPNDVSVPANWSLNAIPVNGDDVYFDQGNYDALYGLNQSGVTPNSVNVLPGYSGKIGLPKINAVNASATYYEYRPDYLQYGATTVVVNGGGGRIKIDNGSTAVTWNILATGTRVETGVPTLLIKGANNSNALNLSKGDMAVSWFAGESSTLGTLNIGYQTNPSSDSTIYLGPDVTFNNCAVTITGGNIRINSSVTSTGSITQLAGTTYFGTGNAAALAQLTLLGGTFVYNGTGTLGGNTKLGGTGTLDFSQDLRAKTITNPIELYGTKCSINDPNAVTNSGTLAVGFNETADADQVNWGQNFRLTRSATP
jgi:hypothetical protein